MEFYMALPFVNAIFMDENRRVLIGNHANSPRKPYPGAPDVPGGKVEEDETLEGAIRREIWEETRLIPGDLCQLGAFHHSRSTFLPSPNRIVPGICVCYLVTRWEGTPVSLELENLRWVPIEEALMLDLTPWARYFLERL